MEKVFLVGATAHTIHVKQTPEAGYSIQVGEQTFDVKPFALEQNRIILDIDGKRRSFFAAEDGDKLYVFFEGRQFFLERSDGSDAFRTDQVGFGRQDAIVTPMPGRMVKILVSPGDRLEPGQPVFVIESMKMENEVKSMNRCTVKRVLVSEGDSLNHGDTVAELEAPEQEQET